jgi:hypothetical protein
MENTKLLINLYLLKNSKNHIKIKNAPNGLGQIGYFLGIPPSNFNPIKNKDIFH